MKYLKIKLIAGLVLASLAFAATYFGVMSEGFTSVLNTVITIIAI